MLMYREISLLLKLELCNFWGINVLRHNKDRKEQRKGIAMAVLLAVVVLVLGGYVGGLCYGLIYLGIGEVIPAYLMMLGSIITLMFGIFKTGGTIFRKQGYEVLSSLPLSKWAVVISRFLRLYIENLLCMLVVLLPGVVLYGIFLKPGIGFYLMSVLCLFVTPLLPVAVSAAIGALVTGIASRMKNKAVAEAGLMMIVVVGIMLFGAGLADKEDQFTMELLKNMADQITQLIGMVYPPALWLGQAMIQGNVLTVLGVGAAFLAVFGVVIAVVAVNFHEICRRLYSTSAKHNYQAEHLQRNALMKAMVLREAKHYFSSGIYVSNTIIGPVMAVVLSVGLFFFDLDNMAGTLPVAINVRGAIPFAIGAVFSMMSATCVSISMEGKTVWILQSLPLSKKTILDAKILFQLCLEAPFYFVAVLLGSIALKADVVEVLWLILIPAVLLVFTAVFGITVNLWLPKMNWESETAVVKQSAATVVGGLGGMVFAVLSAAGILLIPESYYNLAVSIFCALFILAAAALYTKNNRV